MTSAEDETPASDAAARRGEPIARGRPSGLWRGQIGREVVEDCEAGRRQVNGRPNAKAMRWLASSRSSGGWSTKLFAVVVLRGVGLRVFGIDRSHSARMVLSIRRRAAPNLVSQSFGDLDA